MSDLATIGDRILRFLWFILDLGAYFLLGLAFHAGLHEGYVEGVALLAAGLAVLAHVEVRRMRRLMRGIEAKFDPPRK